MAVSRFEARTRKKDRKGKRSRGGSKKRGGGIRNVKQELSQFFFWGGLFRATPAAYESSQARGWI